MTQATALDILKTGVNVFLTGEPGAGKSHTINTYTAYLRQHNVEHAVTASTGIAATHIGGMTVHAWAGIGIKRTLTEYDLDAIAQNERVVKRVRNAKVLIIDEISMLAAETLEMVDIVCKTIKNSTKSFGGLQVVLVGDFFQLPPIVSSVPSSQMEISYEEPGSPFAFRSSAWRAAHFLVCYLSEQHRQEDAAFLTLLSAVRSGTVGESVHKALKARMVAPKGAHTTLYPHNAKVDGFNDTELAKLPGYPRVFKMEGRGSPPLSLKVGAKVLFTKNNPEEGYYNGTAGEVLEFARMSGHPVVKFGSGRVVEVAPAEWSVVDGGKTLATISQVPLRLAWAITVHKSQGMSLDAASIDLSRAFEYGQGYVALSRVRTLAGLYLVGVNERALQVHPEVLARDEQFRADSDAAEDTFDAMPAKELKELHSNFLTAASRGTTVAITTTKTKKTAPKKRWGTSSW